MCGACPCSTGVNAAAALIRTFTTPLERLDRLPKAIVGHGALGATIAGLAAGAAARYPTRTAFVDETGGLTFGELWRRSLGIAAALEDRGVGPGSRVGLLARNHAGFVECLVACRRHRRRPGPAQHRLRRAAARRVVAESEGIALVLHDDEFAPVVAGCGAECLGEREHQPLALTHRAVRPKRQAGLAGRSSPRVRPAARRARRDRATRRRSRASPRCCDAIPLAARRRAGGAAPAVPRVGSVAPAARARPRCATTVLVAPLRRRGDAAPDARPRRRRARGRAGDAAAPARRRPTARRSPHLTGDRVERVGARRQAHHRRARPVRPGALQPLRLDRGRGGDGRHARRPRAPRPSTAGRVGARRAGRDARRRRRPVAPGRTAASSSAAR